MATASIDLPTSVIYKQGNTGGAHVFDGNVGAPYRRNLAHDFVDIWPSVRLLSQQRSCSSQRLNSFEWHHDPPISFFNLSENAG